MKRIALFLALGFILIKAQNLEYLDPVKLQTRTTPQIQQQAALETIGKFTNNNNLVTVEVIPTLFKGSKDAFTLKTTQDQLHIRASSGLAAVWGFHHFLKKYTNSHVGWQVTNINIPTPLPEVEDLVISNDRFRYYQNVCTASYSFVWWNIDQWMEHLRWMALNGINLALAPVAQEATWAKIYRQLGMTEDEINQHFTGPAFLSWLRMGNFHGWGGPLLKSWHDNQKYIQDSVIDYMYKLGMIPVFPAFNGHVPRAFARIYPNVTFYTVEPWSKFNSDYCCGLFVNPTDPLFKRLGKMFLAETTAWLPSHIYHSDPFNEIRVQPWSTSLVENTAKAIFSTMLEFDANAVWLLQNWMFVYDSIAWSLKRVKTFLTTVPNGRLLVLDLQSEQWPQYDLYQMYYNQPFIWCMLHNFGGTLGMFGNTQTINNDVYEVRSRMNSTMIGIGLTPEGINQNYVVYDLMLESAWRKQPVPDMEEWVAKYAERRYGCNATFTAWKYLLRSVYSFNSLNRIRGKYVVTRRPSFKIHPWAWYKSKDLFKAFEEFVYVTDNNCLNSAGYVHDLVDLTRQALQYRAEQIYTNLVLDRLSNTWVFNATINQFLDAMFDMERILTANEHFTAGGWLDGAKRLAKNDDETYLYQLNSRNQITMWGPNGEISDYACKQWAELFHYYYIPRWSMFLNAALVAKTRNEIFDEKRTQNIIKATVEKQFQFVNIDSLPNYGDAKTLAVSLFQKWSDIPGLDDLPFNIITSDSPKRTTSSDISDDDDREIIDTPTVTLLHSTTPLV